ncbi:Thiol:disulfide interchange protein DsbB [Colwellia chukchiensis]|uniref:Disulfide bond formation protein B n=1 Tax=Colwellia chukchiensis TaxID=641665 RepID=A0A1H7TNM4_9GAMM|nr:disulfide bond formation protein DsbB [Colwellia chukchiensis]SEL85447.1 Thiol:disulfide interchange protein DsbB [Colwellia chukchiensis]
MNFLSQLALKPRAWQLLAVSALSFELMALYFQYGMGLEPCIMCVYQRTAIWGIFLAGVVGAFTCQWPIMRLIAYGLWGTGAIWGGLIALEHVDMQASTMSFLFSCEFTPNFPSWAPLHQWLPALFEATGDCGDIKWQFLGFTMPQVMVAIFAGYSLALITVVTASLFKNRTI